MMSILSPIIKCSLVSICASILIGMHMYLSIKLSYKIFNNAFILTACGYTFISHSVSFTDTCYCILFFIKSTFFIRVQQILLYLRNNNTTAHHHHRNYHDDTSHNEVIQDNQTARRHNEVSFCLQGQGQGHRHPPGVM